MAEDQAGYRSPVGRAKAATALLGIAAAVQLVAFGSTLLEIGLIYDLEAGLPVSDAEIDANDTRQAVIGGVEVAMVVFTAIPFLMWVHRVHANLRALGAGPFKFTPGWAVGWWFIPFANLVQPVRAMLEAWRGSYPGGARPAPSAALVGLWWGAFLLSGFVGNIAARITLSAETAEMIRYGDFLYLVSAAITVVGVILAIFVVRTITGWQEMAARASTVAAFD